MSRCVLHFENFQLRAGSLMAYWSLRWTLIDLLVTYRIPVLSLLDKIRTTALLTPETTVLLVGP